MAGGEIMAKLENMTLEELYARKVTASVEKYILLKEDFTGKSENWCEKVCKLNCKNPPSDIALVPRTPVDILIIQDYKAFDEPRFKRKGADVERVHRDVIQYIASAAFKAKGDKPKLTFGLTQLLRCQITKDDIKKGKAPTDTVLTKCRPYLLEEIKQRNPKVIISLCTSVTKALGYKKTNYGNRGEIDGKLVITLHPRTLLMLRQNASGKFWGPDFFQIILRDFRKAAALVRGELTNPNLDAAIEKYKKNIFIARSLDDVREFVQELREAFEEGKVQSFDTETTGLDPWSETAKIITMQFGYRTAEGYIKALVFPMWHRANNYYDANEAWSLIRPLLENPEYKKIGHNMKFDVLYVYGTTGCRIQGVLFDTMLLLHALDSGTQGNLGLKQAVWDYLPHTELGGYEDRLPKLHTRAQIAKLDAEGNEVESEEEGEESDG